MNYFLDTNFSELNPILNAEESKHALRSLRLRIGDELIVGNGNGHRYICSLDTVDGHLAHLKILEVIKQEAPSNQLTIAIAPTKNPSRFEWFLEKATEMGVWEILPISTRHSERTRINDKRAGKILHAASKQSQRFYIPRLQEVKKLDKINLVDYEHHFLAHCDENYERIDLVQLISKLKGRVLILIGPEGDFSPEEIQSLVEKGFTGVSLGKNRLRTETAGVYAAAIFSAHMD